MSTNVAIKPSWSSSPAIQAFTATASQTLFTLTQFTYVTGTNTLDVSINGVDQAGNFTETSGTSFTVGAGLVGGEIVVAKLKGAGAPVVAIGAMTANDFRLSLTSGTYITTSDVTGAGTLYLTPRWGGIGRIWVLAGGIWTCMQSAEVSLALTLTSAKNYWVYAYANGSALALELGTVWAGDTPPAGEVVSLNGIPVKAADTSRRAVGVIRASGTNTTEDSNSKRFVWNLDTNAQRLRALSVVEATASWANTSATWHQTRSQTGNKFEFVTGEAAWLEAHATQIEVCSSGDVNPATGVGIDSTSTNSAQTLAGGLHGPGYGAGSIIHGVYRGTVAAGYHAINWLEYGAANCTVYSNATNYVSGMTGSVLA